MNISVLINEVDRTSDISWEKFRLTDHIEDKVNKLNFELNKAGVSVPSLGQEVVVRDGEDKIFAGTILTIDREMNGLRESFSLEAVDFTHNLGRSIIVERFDDQTIGEILTTLISRYHPRFSVEVTDGEIEISTMTFNNISVLGAIQKLAQVTNYRWYVDYDKKLHFFPKETNPSPFDLTDLGGKYIFSSLELTDDISQLRNAVKIRGGSMVAEERTETFDGDGDKKTFSLANKFSQLPIVRIGEIKESAHYKLDEDAANTTVVDSAGVQATATSSRNTADMSVAGKINTALDFNGVSDYINIPHHASQLLTNGFTISAWINPNSAGGSNIGRIVDKSAGTSAEDGFYVGTWTNGRILVTVNGTARNLATGGYSLGIWQHLIISVNASGILTGYINNVSLAVSGDGAVGAPSGITTTNDLRIGNRSGATDRAFDGGIDDLRIYAGVLTEAERNFLYNDGEGTDEALPLKVGVDYLDNDEDFDVLWNFNEKYIRFVEAPTSGSNNISVTGTPLIPIVVRKLDLESINQYGLFEFYLRDNTIRSREEALAFGDAQLEAYKNSIKEAAFATYETGLRSGQIINIQSDLRSLNEDFIIQQVTMSMRGHALPLFQVDLATVRTVGIIDFLQGLVRTEQRIVLQDQEQEPLLTLRQFDDSFVMADQIGTPVVTTTEDYVWGPAGGGQQPMVWDLSTWA